PPARVTAAASRPPAVATSGVAPARVSASAISTVACSLPPVSRRGTTCNMVTLVIFYALVPRLLAPRMLLRMDDQEPQFLEVGAGEKRRRIAYRLSGG